MTFLEQFKSSDHVSHENPERTLWLAVIDRAMADYILGDDLEMSGRVGLRWFLFSNDPYPFNLMYLCNILFDDGIHAVNAIRKRLFDAVSQGDDWPEKSGYVRRRYNLCGRIN